MRVKGQKGNAYGIRKDKTGQNLTYLILSHKIRRKRKEGEGMPNEAETQLAMDVECSDCDCIVSGADAINGRCPDCAEHYTACELCSREVHDDNAMYDSAERTYCEDCYHDRYTYCEACEREIRCNDTYSVHDDTYCEDCYHENYTECSRCGDILSNEDAHTYDDEDYCQDCLPSSGGIHAYHQWRGDLRFYGCDDRTETLALGIELETDKYDNRGDAANDLCDLSDDETLFHLEEDSSLNNGIEIISQPCSASYHRDEFPWREVCDTVLRYGGRSHDTSTCGLHVHVDRRYLGDTQAKRSYTVMKLILLSERWYRQLATIARRESNGYARRFDADDTACDDDLDADAINDKISQIADKYHRYQMLNLQPRHTIEFRIFRGTLNRDTLIATIQFVDWLVKLAMTTGLKRLQTLTWDDAVKTASATAYPELAAYLTKKNLRTEVSLVCVS